MGEFKKATLNCLDDTSKSFTFQFNPKEVKLNKKLTWKVPEESGQDKNLPEFQKGDPILMQFDAYFDTTLEQGTASVNERWINGLLDLTKPDFDPASGEGAELDKKRPARLQFCWAGFEMTCVIESLMTTYLMFGTDGTPLRAKVKVKLKQFEEDTTYTTSAGTPVTPQFVGLISGSSAAGSSSSSGASSASSVQVVQASAGDTVTSLASDYGADWRDLADANGIDDPMQDLAGMVIAIFT